MIYLQWITILLQVIYSNLISAECDFSTNDQEYDRYRTLIRELICIHDDINDLMFSNYDADQISRFSIRESNTKFINPGVFHSMYNLQIIKIRNSDISEISKGVFTGFSFITTIDISANNISKVEPYSFSGLKTLHLLNISRNTLESIDFLGSSLKYNINVLDLSNNKISNITDQLAVLTELRVLNLTRNLISTLDEDSFSNLKQLEILILAENQITNIPIGTFEHAGSLKILNLSKNNISSMPLGTFAGLSSLSTIDLSFNEIKSFSPDILHDLHQVRTFYINNNFIVNLNAGVFLDHLPYLQVISLEGNNWTCNKLSEIIRSLRSRKITLRLGENFKERNINGIACSDESDNEITEQSVNLNNGNQKAIEVDLEKLKSYFASDFKQSEFYQFFSEKFPKEFEDSFKDARLFKHVDDDFLNSKFYKYFAEGYINSTFFEYLDKKLEAMKELRASSSEEPPYSKSDYEELLKNSLSEYFDSLKPNNDYLREVDAEEKDRNALLKTQNVLMIALIFILVVMWVTQACKSWKINETKEFVVNYLKSRQHRGEIPNSEDQLL